MSKPHTIQHFSHNHALTEVNVAGTYTCNGCKLYGTGKTYRCEDCDYDLHEYCATCPTTLGNSWHAPDHELSLITGPTHMAGCYVCRVYIQGMFYKCKNCSFESHPLCAHGPMHASSPGGTTVTKQRSLHDHHAGQGQPSSPHHYGQGNPYGYGHMDPYGPYPHGGGHQHQHPYMNPSSPKADQHRDMNPSPMHALSPGETTVTKQRSLHDHHAGQGQPSSPHHYGQGNYPYGYGPYGPYPHGGGHQHQHPYMNPSSPKAVPNPDSSKGKKKSGGFLGAFTAVATVAAQLAVASVTGEYTV